MKWFFVLFAVLNQMTLFDLSEQRIQRYKERILNTIGVNIFEENIHRLLLHLPFLISNAERDE